jgi:hypothetical protein
MKSLFLTTMSILTVVLVISAGNAFANSRSDNGGFCRGIDPAAPQCHGQTN